MRLTPFLSIPSRSLYSHFRLVEERGLNLEIQLDWDSLDNPQNHAFHLVRKAREKTGMEITLHAPFIDMAPGASDPLMRRATMTRLEQTANLAQELGARMIVVHPGYDEKRYWMDLDGFKRRSVETWRRFMDMAEPAGCDVALENIFERRPEILVEVMEMVDTPRFGACFDTGHFNVFSKVSVEEWLKVVGPHVLELHLHNNYGEHDDHNGMKSGVFDFARFFSAFNQYIRPGKTLFTLEPHKEEGVDESLEALAGFGYSLPMPATLAQAQAV
ncbi:MAG: sugar phosphate isomerase/epimerase [Nitrospinae bacterium]|nr:sugar phosphate isomerase/epimerase [Nitrospinota bacterium]